MAFMICMAEDVVELQAFCAVEGWGEGCFSIPLVDDQDQGGPVTHWSSAWRALSSGDLGKIHAKMEAMGVSSSDFSSMPTRQAYEAKLGVLGLVTQPLSA